MKNDFVIILIVKGYQEARILKLIGESLSKPHIDHDNGPHVQNNGISVCIIYPAFVTPWFLRSMYALKCSTYSGTLTCSRAWFTTPSTALNCKNYKRFRQVNAQIDGVNGSSLLRHWQQSCSCPETCQCDSVTQKWPAMGCQTVLLNVLWRSYHIEIGMTLNLLQCLRVIGWCRAAQTNSAERSLALLVM